MSFKILNADDTELMRISQEETLYLNLNEMQAILSHFATLQRNPIDVGLETFPRDLVPAIERYVHVSVESARIIDGLPDEITES